MDKLDSISYLDSDDNTIRKKMKTLIKMMEGLDEDQYAPDISDIYRVFRICNDVDKIRCVIIGQDPYPQINKAIVDGETEIVKYADGISFSAFRAEECPDSLFNLLSIVANDPYICSKERSKNLTKDKSYTLSSWVKQGVLMINARMLYLKGKYNDRVEIITTLSREIIKHIITKLEGKHIPYLMFGNEAKYFSNFIDKTSNLVIELKHPSNFAQKKKISEQGKHLADSKIFSYINNFIVTNRGEPIDWSRPLSNE